MSRKCLSGMKRLPYTQIKSSESSRGLPPHHQRSYTDLSVWVAFFCVPKIVSPAGYTPVNPLSVSKIRSFRRLRSGYLICVSEKLPVVLGLRVLGFIRPAVVLSEIRVVGVEPTFSSIMHVWLRRPCHYTRLILSN